MQMQLLSWELAFHRRRPDISDLSLIYDSLAPTWTAKDNWMGMGQAYVGLFQRLKVSGRLPRLNHQSRVLDVGIGTGALALALHHVQPHGWQLDGVDVSPAMLAQAEIQMAQHGIHHHLHHSDLRQLSFAPNQFDMVMSAHTLEHLPDPTLGIRALTEQLRPGAPLLLIITRRGWLGTLIDAKWGLACPTPRQLTAWLTSAGLIAPQLISLPGRPWCRLMSLAAIAWRPTA